MSVVPIRPGLEPRPSPLVRRIAGAIVRFRPRSRFAKWLWALGAVSVGVCWGWLSS